MTRHTTPIVLALALPLTACGASGGADSGARLSCRHFQNVVNDIADGVLTPDELRDKLKQVDDSARVSQEPGIASNSRDMLRAITAMNDPELADALRRFAGACDDAGL